MRAAHVPIVHNSPRCALVVPQVAKKIQGCGGGTPASCPDQEETTNRGNAYLDHQHPQLTKIVKAIILDDNIDGTKDLATEL